MSQNKNLNLPKLIGHRGVKNLCPENTIESINKAIYFGLSCVEIDVKISQDEIPILLHDDTVDRTTTGAGLAIDFDYKSIKKLDAGKYFYSKNTNIFIPRLVDILELCKKNKVDLNIELKPNKNFEIINVTKICELTRNIKDINIFFSSFDLISFLNISKIFINSNRSFLVDSFDEYSIEDLLSILKVNHASICGLNIKIISKEIIKKIKENDISITVYSDENIKLNDAKECFNIGIDSIFTDDPRELINKL